MSGENSSAKSVYFPIERGTFFSSRFVTKRFAMLYESHFQASQERPAVLFRTRADHGRSLPLVVNELAQLSIGGHEPVAIQTFGHDIILVIMHIEPRTSGQIVPHPDWCVLFVPLRCGREFVVNGQDTRLGNVFLSGGSDGYATLGEDRISLAIGLRKARLSSTLQAITGQHDVQFDIPDCRIDLAPPALAGLLNAVTPAITTALQTPIAKGQYEMPSQLEADLFVVLANLLSGHLRQEKTDQRTQLSPVSIIHRAKSAVRASEGQPVSLADLCRASGVGKVWLHKCFAEVHGVSPMTYLRHHRLTLARDRLLDRTNPPRSVKDAALSLGFTNSGRFAAQYSKLFGELPGETLLQNPANGRFDKTERKIG